LTVYHAKYFAHELTKRCASDSVEKLATALSNAQVDLNPHQIEAALFAFRSPLSKGAILADEVGLGKTIEAGILLAQKWAERKRRLLIICPANLRKQWSEELADKFFLITLPSAALRSSAITLMGSGIGSISLDGMVKSIGELMQATVPGGFEIAIKTFPLSEVEHVWAAAEGRPRIVFQMV